MTYVTMEDGREAYVEYDIVPFRGDINVTSAEVCDGEEWTTLPLTDTVKDELAYLITEDMLSNMD